MQIETAAAIDLSKEKKQNESSFSDQMKAYIKHPGSGVLALLTLLGVTQSKVDSNDRNISGKNMQEKQINKRKWGH